MVILLSLLSRLRLKKDEMPSGFEKGMNPEQAFRVHDFEKEHLRHQDDSYFLHLHSFLLWGCIFILGPGSKNSFLPFNLTKEDDNSISAK